MKYIRRLLRLPAPLISAEKAVQIAKIECQIKGWGWGQPRVSEGIKTWRIWADRNTKPSAFVVVDQQTGRVVRSGYGDR